MLAMLAALSAHPVLAADDLAARGEEIAELHCSRCHVVSPENRMTGISSTPSFMILISALPDWHERFASFYARLPHPAHVRFEDDAPRPEDLPATTKEVILKVEDIDAIVAYAEKLAAEDGH
ncbi:hypothetical protein H2509_01640 [Stappia sp. F7233]|uniref:Cytochrome c domain-containing protein n=1 Tax=Stappia albiluteola TaxID=2758565 RepID=A0A839A8G6_9HYPH|nr:hypothetical protein [Stappia albiluteola]MBA5775823.1 hypothetical protein [Stappia albiluteola]